jgi:hypothetical protein
LRTAVELAATEEAVSAASSAGCATLSPLSKTDSCVCKKRSMAATLVAGSNEGPEDTKLAL